MPVPSPPLAGLDCRGLRLADQSSVAALVAASERYAFGHLVTTPLDLVSRWQRPGFDLPGSSLGYFDGAVPVAFGELGSSADLVVHVSPLRRGEGLGSDLAEWGEAVARRRGFSTLRQMTAASDVAAAAALAERQYVRGDTTWILVAGAPEDAPPAAPDLVVRPPRTDQRAVADRLLERHGDLAVRRAPDLGGRLVVTGHDPWELSAESVQVATVDERVVGACVAEDAGSICWIRQLSVDTDHRGRGIARMLLLATLRAAAGRGRERVSLVLPSGPHLPSLHDWPGLVVAAELWAWRRPLFVR
ncbi:GNAT family N-acetyltransferase [Nocardioides sp. zg-1308]|uniref:GNAT family N-acetyltransferase n=1 Tax=Nocardioides renjunii TaxID=3095075 RepID=A0ABU5K684_9ACTN|nr:GNAT family N-acetyltransferase [Nocardioides sp. S-58]MDZ5660391.1 GNAT family N-acetyltransferase [Nocardioides sp. S-58]NPD03501.1 GNAT family N-acetyltransferase [Nocardioides sp. zg-1308]